MGRELDVTRRSWGAGSEPLETLNTSTGGATTRLGLLSRVAGRVSIDMERLQQWSVDLGALARTVATALNFLDGVGSITPGRVWLLGARKFDDHMRDVFLVRGVTWPDSHQILESKPRLANSPCLLILCLNRFPDDPEWQDRSRVVFSLAETSWLLPRNVGRFLRSWRPLPTGRADQQSGEWRIVSCVHTQGAAHGSRSVRSACSDGQSTQIV
jgi:hypothetical protein